MSQVAKNNGNGHDSQQIQTLAKGAQSEAPVRSSGVKENFVTFQTADGLALRGALSRVTRHAVFFELHNPNVVPRFSEALGEFKIVLQDRTIYSGRAVVRNVLNDGLNALCETTLNEAHWKDVDVDSVTKSDDSLIDEFKTFIQEWQKLYKVLPEYKEAVADIKIFLTDLRIWLEQIELGIRSSPKLSRAQLEEMAIDKLSPQIIPMINGLFEKFERIAAELDEEARPVHRNYVQRHLHPIVLCAPFAHRTYQKPLGYAGDYEMVNMMVRDPKEGASVFAKIFNVWLFQQGSAAAHRNRLNRLVTQIETEAFRTSRNGNKARIYNFACGPAIEVQRFLDSSPLSEQVELTLADFDSETLEHAKNAIDTIKEQWGWQTSVRFQKKTVYQLMKEGQKPLVIGNDIKHEYDFVYCAGLFDYLPDSTCKQLIKIFYQWLAPGGLLLFTNVTPSSPNQGSLGLILDWHLIYREAAQIGRLCSGIIPEEQIRICSDETGINIFLEARKPDGD
jgi:extracellular factor (EF) 3-hydroxypalmitic acid methyl ester biosynthesis protein